MGTDGGVDRELSRVWRPGRPLDLVRTLAVQRHGTYDPTYLVDERAGLWRSVRTPDGPGTMRLTPRRSGDGALEVHATAWGLGAPWLIDHVPAWLGAHDTEEFTPQLRVLREAAHARPGWRIGAGGLVMDQLVPLVLEQKVTSTAAHHSYRWLLHRYGEPAPGPTPRPMLVPPTARTWALVPSWDWHRAGVGPDRSRTIVQAARLADRLEQATALAPEPAAARLRYVPGIGAWTAAEILQRTHGDPDAVSVGDLHLPRLVIYALSGRVSDSDEEMLELLEPYRGHRYRVTRLLEMSSVRAPRFGPRYSPQDFRAM